MQIHLEGFDVVQRHLNEMQQVAEDAHGVQSVLLSEVVTTEFLQRFTSFASLDELFADGGFVVSSDEDLASIPDEIIDPFIAATTQFISWEALLHMALNEYLQRQLQAALGLE